MRSMQAPRSQTLPDLLDEIAMRLPDRDFIAYDGAHISYSAFRERVRALARSLHASGVRKGDKVAVLMGNRPEWLLVTFATTLLGATFVALNTWWRSRELEYALELSDTKLLIVADRYGNNDYIQALAQIGDLSRKLPLLRTIVCLSDARIVPAGMIDFDAFVESGRNVADATLATAQEEVTPTDIAFILLHPGRRRIRRRCRTSTGVSSETCSISANACISPRRIACMSRFPCSGDSASPMPFLRS
jgi:fatty-acyl-CoA synthase